MFVQMFLLMRRRVVVMLTMTRRLMIEDTGVEEVDHF